MIRAQPGKQADFLAHDADVVVYGGSAGGGKSYGLLLDPLRYVKHPGFRGAVFRRTFPQIVAGGGLWDTAMEVYPQVGAKANRSNLSFAFASGARISFHHLQYDQTVYNWQGAQIPWLGFDEGTHFFEKQFLYLFSRNRSTTGVPCRVRLTCNPDAGSWLAGYLKWWLTDAGYPDPAKSGRVRWLYRKDDENYWYPTRREAEAAHPDLAAVARPKSWAFVPAALADNPLLEAASPDYRANLLALSWVERERLLGGNWRVTAADGLFRADWFAPPADPPDSFKKVVRAWDLAATEQTDANDPDWLAGVKLGLTADGGVWVLDAERHRVSPLKVRNLIQTAAERDGPGVHVVVEQEPGAAGKILAAELRAWLGRGTDDDGRPKPRVEASVFRPDQTTGDKVTRAYPFSAACERGVVRLAPGPWVKGWLAELCQFPTKGVHDDLVDASASGYRALTRSAGVRVLTV